MSCNCIRWIMSLFSPGGMLRQALVWLPVVLAVDLSHARTLDDVRASGYLSVAVYRDFPPYAYRQGDLDVGVDVDVARALAQGLGVELRLHWMIADENLDDDLRNHVWKGHFLARDEDGPMLVRRVADVMMRAPYDREFAYKVDPDGRVINDLVHFFAPYQRESWALVYDRERIETIENLALFQYQKIGVEIDSLPDFYLSGAFAGRLRNNVEHFSSTSSAVDGMLAGRVTAVMGMQSQLQWQLARQHEWQGRYRSADVPFPNLLKRHWDVGMAVKDSHRQLAYGLGDIVDELVSSGRMAQIYQRYGVSYQLPDRYLLSQ